MNLKLILNGGNQSRPRAIITQAQPVIEFLTHKIWSSVADLNSKVSKLHLIGVHMPISVWVTVRSIQQFVEHHNAWNIASQSSFCFLDETGVGAPHGKGHSSDIECDERSSASVAAWTSRNQTEQEKSKEKDEAIHAVFFLDQGPGDPVLCVDTCLLYTSPSPRD
eukprot:TRINITY_DN282_c0_g1_i2.p1 TRINITY_DN282_c0_g1~~TRINITY_DN282_c0_g1_i2.p1  ORF type:complete len:181 (-),score=29.64 TRINITY_DN282_c0_g1_i2:32-526(-)